MAYCVHCGVKLDSGEKHCPLCQCPVIDPLEPNRKITDKAFQPHTKEQTIKNNRRFFLILFLCTMLFPALLCLVINLILNNKITWSAYPSAALTLLFISSCVPFFVKKYKNRMTIFSSYILLSLYIFMCEQISGSTGWFLSIVFPALTLATGMVLLVTTLFSKNRLSILSLLGMIFLGIALLSVFLQYLICAYVKTPFKFSWSLFVSAPSLFISAMLFFISAYAPFKDELKRRMHF